jgi:glyoxylase-like metal-dependent hydrolase (beta-lactamase superfamily II)
MKNALCKSLLALPALLAMGGLVNSRPVPQSQDLSNVEIHILPVQGNVYMLTGPGVNSAVQVGRQGVLLVDTQLAPLSEKILAAIANLSEAHKKTQLAERIRGVLPVMPASQGKLRYLINTNADGDHTGGNENLRKAGITLTGANVTREIADARVGAALIAHENVLARMSAPTGQQSPMPPAAWRPVHSHRRFRESIQRGTTG